jgi:outer membrane protein
MLPSWLPDLRAWSFVLFAGLFMSAACRAEDDQYRPSDSTLVKHDGLSAGLAVSDADPGYVGDHDQLTAYPWFTYRNGHFFVYGLAPGYEVANGQNYILSVMAVPQIQRRSSSHSPQLSGLQYRPWSIDGGANLAIWGTAGGMYLGVFHDVLDRNNGASVRAAYFLPIRVGKGEISPSIGVSWEDAKLASYYYGVNAAEARPGRPAYSPGSVVNPTAELKYERQIGKRWHFSAKASYVHFGGAISRSPIVDESSAMSYEIALLYSFGAA